MFLHNALRQDKGVISTGSVLEWVNSSPLFIREDRASLAHWVETFLLPADLLPNEHLQFSQAKYQQSQHLFAFIREHAKDIAISAEVAIANSGMGLTAQQDRLKNEIMSALETKDKTDFIIQGFPGSGKTLLAVSLLLKAVKGGFQAVLALRNNRLQAILRQVLDNSYPGVSGLMMFFEPRQGVGIAQFDGFVDLLICDESQRMESRIMPGVLQKARVSAIFLDETQRLNPPEQGTRNNFANASASIKRNPMIRTLDASVRCQGGAPYAEWVERLLSKPSEVASIKTSISNLAK